MTETARLLRFDELAAQDLLDWRTLAAAHVDYCNPHLQPDYSRHISAFDDTTRIVLIHSGADLVGVIPISLRRGGFARAVGAPFFDYSGPVLSSQFNGDLPDLLASVGLSAFRFNASPDPFGHLSQFAKSEDRGFRIDVEAAQSGADLLESLRAANPKLHKNFRRLRNKIETDGLSLRVSLGAPEPEALESALRWKSEQLVRAGRIDVVNLPRGDAVLSHFRHHWFDGQSGGYQLTIHFNGTPVAVEFGVRSGAAFQPWIAAYNQAFQGYSPGNQLMREFVLRLPETGIRHYDLGTGHGDYKKYFCNAEVRVLSGTIYAAGMGGRIRKLRGQAVRAIAKGPLRLPVEKLAGRIDHIAGAETRSGEQVKLFARSLMFQLRR